jgi:hypothetical protein
MHLHCITTENLVSTIILSFIVDKVKYTLNLYAVRRLNMLLCGTIDIISP